MERLSIIKARLQNHQKDLLLVQEINKDIDKLRNGMVDLGSGLSNTDPVQGGGSSQEDRYFDALDEIMALETVLKRIELENRAIVNTMKDLSEEDKDLVKHLWIVRDKTMRSMEKVIDLKKSAIQKRSDKALLYIHKKIYIESPQDVDPR